MSKRNSFGDGFALVETMLVLVIIGIIVFAGWFVLRAKHNTDKTLSGTGSSQAASGKTGGNDNQSLQNDLSGINSADNQTTKDINASNSGLNDSSTFTSLP